MTPEIHVLRIITGIGAALCLLGVLVMMVISLKDWRDRKAGKVPATPRRREYL